MLIAMDYDDTFTADPELWTAFSDMAKIGDHKVICVTARYYSPESKEELRENLPPGMLIYFTEHGSKIDYLASLGVFPSVWIDDNPRVVVHGV